MTTYVKSSSNLLKSKSGARKTWQLNRHLAAQLDLKLLQIKKKSVDRDFELKQTIEELKKEIKARKFEETECARNSFIESELLRSPTVSSLRERRETASSFGWSSTSSLRPLSAPPVNYQEHGFRKRASYRRKSCYVCSQKSFSAKSLLYSRPHTSVETRKKTGGLKVRFNERPHAVNNWLSRERYLSKNMV